MIEINYRSKALKDCLTDARKCQKLLGELAKPTLRRLTQLKAMTSIQELFDSGLDNPEILKGTAVVTLSWAISANYRLEFDLGIPASKELSGQFKTITKVFIKGVRDYHGSNKTKQSYLIA
jgi:plasmid maintenance system killer protein